jgi:NAD(P)-dependent dehydrogenase (short-subunit alcohol dehydrogenase family)
MIAYDRSKHGQVAEKSGRHHRRHDGDIACFVPGFTVELKDRLIRSNILRPGPTDTLAIGQQPAEATARIVSTIPIGRMGGPDAVAKAALFLASDDPGFVTGIQPFFDGGRAQI